MSISHHSPLVEAVALGGECTDKWALANELYGGEDFWSNCAEGQLQCGYQGWPLDFGYNF